MCMCRNACVCTKVQGAVSKLQCHHPLMVVERTVAVGGCHLPEMKECCLSGGSRHRQQQRWCGCRVVHSDGEMAREA